MIWPRSPLVVAIASAAIVLAVLYVAYRFVDPLPPRHLAIAAGMAGSGYDNFARQYARILARYGVELDIRNSAGAVKDLELLRDPSSRVQVALITFGFRPIAHVHKGPSFPVMRASLPRQRYLGQLTNLLRCRGFPPRATLKSEHRQRSEQKLQLSVHLFAEGASELLRSIAMNTVVSESSAGCSGSNLQHHCRIC